jgi:2-keto-4-pentenoate hydratase/2-oxohepta-3-ene-1,7-dioic acid hydratase in catechol pathway
MVVTDSLLTGDGVLKLSFGKKKHVLVRPANLGKVAPIERLGAPCLISVLPPAAAVGRDSWPAERFPVRRIFCVGRNYAAHAREMGKDPTASRLFSSPSRPTP